MSPVTSRPRGSPSCPRGGVTPAQAPSRVLSPPGPPAASASRPRRLHTAGGWAASRALFPLMTHVRLHMNGRFPWLQVRIIAAGARRGINSTAHSTGRGSAPGRSCWDTSALLPAGKPPSGWNVFSRPSGVDSAAFHQERRAASVPAAFHTLLPGPECAAAPRMDTRAHAHTCMHAHTCVHTHMHTHMRTHPHAHTHAHTSAPGLGQLEVT